MILSRTESSPKTGYLKSNDETPLFYRHYPVKNKKARIFLLHGFGEHSGRYAHVIDRLVNELYEVFCIDLRGHGHSKGERGHVDRFHLYEDDVVAGLNHITNNLKGDSKLFLLAHSMGGLVGLRAINRLDLALNGIVLSSPFFGLKIPVPAWKKYLSLLVARAIPRLRLGTGIKGRLLSSDENAAVAYDNDPLVVKNLSIRAFHEISYGLQNTKTLAQSLSSSLFIQIAGNDFIVDRHKAEQWFKCVDAQKVDASLKIYPDFLHEIYNETKRHEPLDDLMLWLNQRT